MPKNSTIQANAHVGANVLSDLYTANMYAQNHLNGCSRNAFPRALRPKVFVLIYNRTHSPCSLRMLLEAYDQKNAWINNLAPLSIVRHKLHIIHVRLSRLNKHEMLSLLDVESEERPSKFFSTSHLRLISLAKKHLLHTGVRRFCSASAARYDYNVCERPCLRDG